MFNNQICLYYYLREKRQRFIRQNMENNHRPINFFKIFKNPFLMIFFGVLLFYGHLLVGEMPYFGDYLTYQLPEKVIIRECLLQGTLPFMNPYILSGSPILENIATGALNPLNLLLLLGNPVFAFNLFIFVNVLLAGWAMYVFCRFGFGFNWRVACLAALAYSIGGVLWGMIDKGFIVSAWLIPLFFYGLIAFYIDKLPRKFAWLLSVIGLTGLFYSGNLLETYFAIVIAGIGLIWYELTSNEKRDIFFRSVIQYIWIVITAIFLAGIQLIPTFFASQISCRSDGVELSKAQSWSFPIIRGIEYFIPFAFGSRERGGMYFGEFYVRNAEGANGSPWFDSVFLGFPLICSLIVMIIFAIKNHSLFEEGKTKPKLYRRPLFIMGTGLAFFFLLALGKYFPLYRLCYLILPGFKVFRHPEKHIEWVNIFLIIIGAYGLNMSLRKKSFAVWVTFRNVVLFLLCCYCTVLAIIVCWYLFYPAKYSNFFKSYGSNWIGEQIFMWQLGTLSVSIIFLVLMLVVLRVFKDFPKRIMIAFIWITLFNLVLWSYMVNWTIPVKAFRQAKTWNELLPKIDRSQWRIYAGRQFYFNSGIPELVLYTSLKDNSSVLKKIRIPSGFSALMESKYYDFFNFEKHPPMRVMNLTSVKYIGAPFLLENQIPPSCNVIMQDQTKKMMILENRDALPRIDAYNKYQQIDEAALSKALFYSKTYDPGKILLSSMPDNFQKSIKLGIQPKIKILKDLPGFIKLQLTGGPAFVVIRDWFSPGWQCYDQTGKVLPIVPVDGGMIGSFVDKKKSIISLKYSPPGIKIALFISLFGLVILLLGFLMYGQQLDKYNKQTKNA